MSRISETAFAVKESTGKIVYANDAYARLLYHSSAAEVVGHLISEFFSPASAKVLLDEESAIMSSGMARSFEREMPDSQGRKYIYAFCKFPVEMFGTRLLFCICQRNDPTSIPVSNEARARFFSAVSHDLRTPLNAIVGYSQLLQNAQDPAGFREAAAAIGEGSRSLISAVNGLMTLLIPDASTEPPKIETFNASEATQEVCRSFAAAVAANKVKLRCGMNAIPLLEFAGQQYRDVLTRFLEHAVYRTSSGHITVRAAFVSGDLCLSVTDSGGHLTDAELARIMNSSEGDGIDQGGGAMLNLIVAKRIVERINGTFEIRNEDASEGNGVTVAVAFHGVKAAGSSKRAEFARTQKMRTMRIEDPFRYDKKILIVDDRAINLRILSLLLGAMGFKKVTTAAGGLQALELAQQEKFDIILTDLMMPGMDGRQLHKELRKLPNYARAPIYAVTADTSAPVTCKDDGFTGILLKPVTKDMLKEVL